MFQAQIKDCLLRDDPQDLVAQILAEGLSSITLTCLDQVVTEDLCGSGLSQVQVFLKSLAILSKKTDDLLTLVDLGLVSKVIFWFNCVRDLLTSDLHQNSTVLLDLTESFYDYFLLLTPALVQVSQVSAVLLQLAEMGLDPQICFKLRLDAFRTFNSILESLNTEKRKLIQACQNQNLMLTRVATAVLNVGDYELQVSLSETLCRLTPKKNRCVRASQWFSSNDVGRAFSNIRNRDFEVDCRRFLNFVNCYHDDQRVYTFPCLRAFLDSTQLFCPKDDKWDEFWIDFNLGSECVSFFVDNPQSFLWESIHLLKEDVARYSLNVKHDECTEVEMALSVWLNNPLMHQNTTGQKVELIFSSGLYREVEEATEKVFKLSTPENFKVWNHPYLSDTNGSIQVCATKSNHRTYNRKKPKKGRMKVLPLLSTSSDDDFVTKSADLSRAEYLFDQIKDSTATFNSGVSVEEVGPNSCLSQSGSNTGKDVLFSRKRTFPQSSTPPQKRKEEDPVQEGEASTGAPSEACSPERKKTPDRGTEMSSIRAEPDSDLMSGIGAIFKTFTEQLEQHFDICKKKVEAEVLQSQKQCQQHISALLSAVSQHRSVQSQMFQNGIKCQLEQLQETSAKLNFISENLLSLFQSEGQHLNSIYEELQIRLKSLNDSESGAGHSSNQ